jgi:hypothetical protein
MKVSFVFNPLDTPDDCDAHYKPGQSSGDPQIDALAKQITIQTCRDDAGNYG